MAGSGGRPTALYVHVPFCLSKCDYCDFTSATTAPDVRVASTSIAATCGSQLLEGLDLGDAYVTVALQRVEQAAERGVLSSVSTVYVGGGTPTRLGSRPIRLVSGVRAVLHLESNVEFTVETNPDTTDAARVRELVEAGVNRFSLGVQSFDDSVLTVLGRRHDAATARSACEILRATGRAFSVDLICGVPGQSELSWRETLEAAVASGAGHVSVYPLTVEEGTLMSARVESGLLVEPDSDSAASMMETAAELLGEAGLRRYEVASYARRNQHSQHNTGYWTGVPYVGIGPSAASMLDEDDYRLLTSDGIAPDRASAESRVRFVESEDLPGFLCGSWEQPPSSFELLTPDESAREDAMLGLRRSDGIEVALAARAGVLHVLEELQEKGLVVLDGSRWRPTGRGWLLGNEVFSRVWAGE